MRTLAYDIQTQEQPAPRKWTREEYYRMAETGILGPGDHVELIEGEIVNKVSPQNTPHAQAIRLLTKALITSFGPEFDFGIQLPMSIEGDSDPEPDAVVTRFGGRRFLDQHPTPADVVLAVEIADSSLGFDRGRKARLYSRAGVQDYWIVNLVDRQIEVMTNPIDEHGYRTTIVYRAGETIQPPVLGARPIAVDDLLP